MDGRHPYVDAKGCVDKRERNGSPHIAVRFDAGTFYWLRSIAKERGVSVARVIREFVARGLEAPDA